MIDTLTRIVGTATIIYALMRLADWLRSEYRAGRAEAVLDAWQAESAVAETPEPWILILPTDYYERVAPQDNAAAQRN